MSRTKQGVEMTEPENPKTIEITIFEMRNCDHCVVLKESGKEVARLRVQWAGARLPLSASLCVVEAMMRRREGMPGFGEPALERFVDDAV
jgi:hypothetical protein